MLPAKERKKLKENEVGASFSADLHLQTDLWLEHSLETVHL